MFTSTIENINTYTSCVALVIVVVRAIYDRYQDTCAHVVRNLRDSIVWCIGNGSQ